MTKYYSVESLRVRIRVLEKEAYHENITKRDVDECLPKEASPKM